MKARILNLHISVLPEDFILLVVFDDRSSLGLVRLRVRKSSKEIIQMLEAARNRGTRSDESALPFAEITDDEIESLFPFLKRACRPFHVIHQLLIPRNQL